MVVGSRKKGSLVGNVDMFMIFIIEVHVLKIIFPHTIYFKNEMVKLLKCVIFLEIKRFWEDVFNIIQTTKPKGKIDSILGKIYPNQFLTRNIISITTNVASKVRKKIQPPLY